MNIYGGRIRNTGKRLWALGLAATVIFALFTVSARADAAQLSESIQALPEPQNIAQSTAELRAEIEGIQEALLEQGLSQENFDSKIWEKWQAVQEKNAYFLPAYETIDISSAARSKAFAEYGDSAKTSNRNVDDYFPYWTMENNLTVWKETIAIPKKDVIDVVGTDELYYSDSGVPFSFPKNQYYAVGTRDSATRRELKLPQPKAYRSIAFAAMTGNRSSSFDLELRYTTGACEVHTFTLCEGWSASPVGNLINVKGLWSGKSDATYYYYGGGWIGIDWFEIPVDPNRELKSVVFRDFNAAADYKVLAVTGCTDVSQQEKDRRTAGFNGEAYSVNLSDLVDSKVTIDPDGEMNRENLTLNEKDYFKYGNYDNCLALDAVDAAALMPDGQGTDKRGTVYYSDLSSGITLRSGETVSVPTDFAPVNTASFLVASGAGTSEENTWLEFVYESGERVRQSFSVPAGYSTADTARAREDYFGEVKKYTSFGPTDGYTYDSNTPTMGLYSIQTESSRTEYVKEIRFCCSGTGIEYKIMALSCCNFDKETLRAQAEQWMAEYVSAPSFALGEKIKERLELLTTCGVDTSSQQGYEAYRQKEEQESSVQLELYVSPQGDDSNSGQSESAPLKSFSLLKEKIRQLRAVAERPITVWLMPGEYREQLILEGEWGTEASPVTFQAVGDVRFTGSRRLEGGSSIQDADMALKIPKEARDKVLEFDLTAQGIDVSALNVMEYDLFLEGKRQPVAQYPNGEDHYAYSEKTVTTGQKGSFIAADSNVEQWTGYRADDAYIGGYFSKDYRYDNALLGAVDPETRTLTLSTDTTYGVGANSFRWKAFHLAQELDEPGEWYLNSSTGKLYYYPPYDIESADLEIAVKKDAMISINNADYLTFRGIHFQNSAGLAIYSGRDTAAKAAGSNITVEDCLFTCLDAGIRLWLGVDPPGYTAAFSGGDNIRIENNSFLYIGGNAVWLYGGDQNQLRTNNSVIANNYMYACGHKRREKYAINLDYTIGTRVKNNVIHRLPATALGYGANDCEIMYNEIYNVLRENEDGGALYSGLSFMLRGNEIAYNYIHDGQPVGGRLRSGSSTGIYLDDGLSGQEVHHNIISNFGCGVLFSGQDNKVYSNTIVNSSMLSIMAKDSESAMAGETMRAPLVDLYGKTNWAKWSSHYPELALSYADSSMCERNVIKDNLIDLSIFLTEPFWRQNKNTIETNSVYGYRTNSIFTQDYLVDAEAGQEYLNVRNGLLSTENFDIKRIGLSELPQKTKPYRNFRLLYPASGELVQNPHSQTFLWEEAAGADFYILEIARDSSFETVVYQAKSLQNRLEVSDFDFREGDYYWRVRAENTSSSLADQWLCSGKPMKLTGYPICQLEGEQNQLDLSPYFNGTAMIEENATDTATSDNRLLENYTMNKTYLRSMLDQKGQVTLGNTVFAMKTDGYKTAANNYNEAITMDVENGCYTHLDFLAGTLNKSGSVQIVYEDGSVQSEALDFAGTGFGQIYVVSLQLSSGKPHGYESGIYTARVRTDSAKQVDKIILQSADSLQNAINLFAVTATAASGGEDEEGTYSRLTVENRSLEERNAVIYRAVYDSSGRLVQILRPETLQLAAEEVKTMILRLPEEGSLRQFIWDEKLMPEARAWLSE